MTSKQASFELIFPLSIIKACAQLTADVQFEVSGFYTESSNDSVDNSVSRPTTNIHCSSKQDRLHFMIQGADDLLCKNLTSDLICHVTSSDNLIGRSETIQSSEMPVEENPKRKYPVTATGDMTEKSSKQKRRKKNRCVDKKESPLIKSKHLEVNDGPVESADMRCPVGSRGLSMGRCEVIDHDSMQYDDHDDDDIGCDDDDGNHESIDTDLTFHAASSSNQTDTECVICSYSLHDMKGLQGHVLSHHKLPWSKYYQLCTALSGVSRRTACGENENKFDESQVKSLLNQWKKLSNLDDKHVEKLERTRSSNRIKKHVEKLEITRSSNRITKKKVYSDVIASESPDVSSRHQCCYCVKSFNSKMGLKIHTRKQHRDVTDQKLTKIELAGDGQHEDADVVGDEVCVKPELNSDLTIRSTEVSLSSGNLQSQEGVTVCLICHKAFAGSNQKTHKQLENHVENDHQISLIRYRLVMDVDKSEDKKYVADEIETMQSKCKVLKKTKVTTKNELFRCGSCFREYPVFKSLLSHVRRAHHGDDNYRNILLDTEEQGAAIYLPDAENRELLEIVCVYCGVRRVGKYITKHLHLLHNHEEDIKKALINASDSYKECMKERDTLQFKKRGRPSVEDKSLVLTCKYCGVKFNDRWSRYRHSRFKCPKNGEPCKKLYCRCGHHFVSQESLSKHKTRCDLVDKTCICHLCGKMYATKNGLFIHKQTTHCEDIDAKYKYKCDICNIKYYKKTQYMRHMRIHTDVKVCKCELCGKHFKTLEDVRNHKWRIHDNRYPYHCKSCGHGVSKRSYLQSHKCGRVRRPQNINNTTFKELAMLNPEQDKTKTSDSHGDSSYNHDNFSSYYDNMSTGHTTLYGDHVNVSTNGIHGARYLDYSKIDGNHGNIVSYHIPKDCGKILVNSNPSDSHDNNPAPDSNSCVSHSNTHPCDTTAVAIGNLHIPLITPYFTANTAPVALNTEPVSLNTAPVALNTEPVSFNTAPVSLNTAPVSLNTLPVPLNPVPVSLYTTPVSLNTAPVSLNTLPVSLNTLPVALNTKPVSLNTSPVSLNTAPFSPNHVPVSLNTAPVSLNPVPVSLNTATVSQNTAPVSLNTVPVARNTEPVSLNTAPVPLNTAPVSLNTTTVSLNTVPVSLNTAAVSNDIRNVSPNSTPVSLNSAPVSLNTAPVSINTSSVSLNTVPVSLNAAHVSLDTAPVSLNTVPVSLNAAHVSLDTAPVSLNTMPVSLTTAPVLPVDMSRLTSIIAGMQQPISMATTLQLLGVVPQENSADPGNQLLHSASVPQTPVIDQPTTSNSTDTTSTPSASTVTQTMSGWPFTSPPY